MSRSDTTDSSQPLDQTQQEPDPLAPRIVHKFFEPIILLVALIDAVRNTAKPRPLEPEVNVQDPKQLFCAFVYKLSHLCDKERGGDTVTSFVVLKDQSNPQRAHYVFAVNQQTNSQLQITSTYVKTLLRKVDRAPEGQANQRAARHSLLYHVLRFNRRRVSFYLRELQSQAADCHEKCQADRTAENNLIAEELADILTTPYAGSEDKDPETDYFRKCETTIQILIRIEKSRVGKVIEDRALEDIIPGFRSRECWAEFLHTMRRVLAYQQSIQFLLLAKEKWPSLFRNATVSFISSSRPVPKPIRNKSQSAEGIVGRMTRKEKEITIFRNFAQALQAFSLDDRIKEEYGKDSFRPIVHAEVLLLDWISRQGGIIPSRFFNDWMYIGGSKPTCKLCDCYFHEHKSNVGHRLSSGTLYPSWRVPDVFPYQGEAGKEARQIMVDRVLQRVRKDAFDIVRKKAQPSVKIDDSNTFSARVTLQEVRSLHCSDTDVDDIASLLGQVDIS